MVDIITYDSFPIRGKVVDLEAIETASGKAEQAVETANQAVTTANNLVSDLQDDIEEAQSYIDSFEHLQETLDNKANVNGTYPSLTAGLAEQLLSSNRVTDQTPYLYRQTALGRANATRALMKKIVGGSVVWNQLCNGSSVTVPSGHKYTAKIGGSWSISASAGTAITGLTAGTDMVTDLTALFGSATIADYIYSLEQATAGSGIAKLREWGFFTEDYYEYNAGTMKSVEGVSAKETVGFNLWDEEWEVGGINGNTGADWATTDRIRSKNYVPVIPNAKYFLESPTNINLILYNADKAFISSLYYYPDDNLPFTTPTDCYYIRFAEQAVYGTTYNHDICINLSDPQRNGEYEPYVKHTYPLDSSLTLRGIPKLDSNNNLYYDGDEYRAVGKYGTRTFDGSDNWTWGTGANLGRVVSDVIPDAVNTSSRTPVSGKNIIDATGTDPYTGFLSSGRFYFYYPTTVTTLDEWKAWVNANPLTITYPITQVTRKYGVVDLGTLTWSYYASYSTMVTRVNGKSPIPGGSGNYAKGLYAKGLLCDKYPVSNYWWTDGYKPDKTISNGEGTNICIKDSAYTNVAAFKQMLIDQNVQLLYELDTPTTETAEPYTEVQVVDKDGTEQFVTSGIVPVGTYTEYPDDMVGKIDELPGLPETAGSYVLRVTVTSGKASYEWVSAS